MSRNRTLIILALHRNDLKIATGALARIVRVELMAGARKTLDFNFCDWKSLQQEVGRVARVVRLA